MSPEAGGAPEPAPSPSPPRRAQPSHFRGTPGHGGAPPPQPRLAQPSRAEPSQAPPGHDGAWRGMAGHGEGAAGYGMARRGMASLPGSVTYNRTRGQFTPGTGTSYALKLQKTTQQNWMSLEEEFKLMEKCNHPSFIRCAARHLSRSTSTEVRKLKAPGGPGASRGVFRGVVAARWWWPGIPLGKPSGGTSIMTWRSCNAKPY